MKKNNQALPHQLRVEGILSRGYGTIPKIVMQDKRLTIEAKGIYAYFSSYAGAGSQAFPSVKKILEDLCIGKDRYYKHLEYLRKFGYLKIEQKTNDEGKFKHNIYTLVTNPIEQSEDSDNEESVDKSVDKAVDKNSEKTEKPLPCFKDTDEKVENKPSIPWSDFTDTDIAYTENKDTNNNKSFNRNISLEYLSIYHDGEEKKLTRDNIYKDLIDRLNLTNNNWEYKNLIEASIYDLVYSGKPIKLGRSYVDCTKVLKDLYMNLDYNAVEFAIDRMREASKTSHIKNHISYLATLIYNTMFDLDAKVKNDLRHLGLI